MAPGNDDGRRSDTEPASQLLTARDGLAELVRQAKARSPEAWAEIYEQNHPKLFRYVQARIGDRDTAEDLTATVFLEALKSIDSYASRGRPLIAWLYRIARNVVNYHYRSLFRKKAHGEAPDVATGRVWKLLRSGRGKDPAQGDVPVIYEAAGGGDPALAVDRLDLLAALTCLSDDQREVVILRYFVGLTTPEVASLVRKHERAVYSLQARAIKALRRHLR